MDNPPPNYNETESVLSGGISDTTIMKVMGGGGEGDGAPNGYNESESVLSGGIADSSILKVMGGGANDNEIIKYDDYKPIDDTYYNTYIGSINTQTANITKVINKLKNSIKKEVPLTYNKIGTIITQNRNNSANKIDFISIKFISNTIKKIIVLPPIDANGKKYFEQIHYLYRSGYINITSDRKFIIPPNTVIINLLPFIITDPITQLLYYTLKKNNPNSYYVVNDPEDPYFLIYSKLGKSILFTNDNKELNRPIDKSVVQPNDHKSLRKIKSMRYKFNPKGRYLNKDFDVITNGTTESITPSNNSYNYTLHTSILILKMADEDYKTVKVDLQGELYRIRLPELGEFDKVYDLWTKESYSSDEQELINNLNLEEIKNINIPKFLLNLSLYKCFTDYSLLTTKECSAMQKDLSILYKYKLKHKLKESHTITDDPNINDEKYNCFDHTITAATATSPAILTCNVNGKPVIIDYDKYLNKVDSTNSNDMEVIHNAIKDVLYPQPVKI